MEEYPKRLKHPSGRWMTLEETKVLVSMTGKPAAVPNELAKIGLVPETLGHPGASKPSGREMLRLNNTASRMWMRTKDGSPVDRKALDKMAAASNSGFSALQK